VTDDALPELRASDAEREQHAEILRRAAGDGRLTFEELDERLNLVYAARTHAELDRLVLDVVPRGQRAPGVREGRVPVRRGEPGPGWLVAIMSGRERKGHWRVSRRMQVINFWGGSDLDLNDAELADDVVEMTVWAVMGGANLRVPDGLNVELSEFALMGGNSAELGRERPDPGGPTLRLKLISIMGGIEVKRGRRRSRDERRRQGHLDGWH
jgi:catechol 2,3-dioxygenase-like lactoylglutathione lyase family enzyme